MIDFVEHLEEVENYFTAKAEGRIYNISINDILYIESVDRKTFGYTVNEETLKELYLYNIDLTELYKNNIIIPKPRCENCSRLTDGINTVIHN